MSEVQWLFAVLAALYCWECACWLQSGSVAFSTWLGSFWRVQHPDALLGNQRGGFILAAPLPPLGSLVISSQLPFSVSPDGVLAHVATNVNPGWRPVQSGKFFRFDGIREVTARHKKLLINGTVFLSVASVSLARKFAGDLQQLLKSNPAHRPPVIAEMLRATLDAKAIERRWREYYGFSRPLKWLANVLFVYLFFAAPAIIWQVGFKLSWLGLLVGLFALTITTAAFFHRGHRMLFPQAEDDRFTQTLTIALAPMTTLRAHDTLSRPLLESYHPLAVAKVFLADSGYRNFARRILLDLRHPCEPLCPNGEPAARAVEFHTRKTLQDEVERSLKRSGIDPEELCRPPLPNDETCRAYCPRCGAQFTATSGTCADCGGLTLVAFASPE